MTSIPLSAEDIIRLAENTAGLEQAELARVKRLCVNMEQSELLELKNLLEDLNTKVLAKRETDQKRYEALAPYFEEYKADKAREERVEAEKATSAADEKAANSLIKQL